MLVRDAVRRQRSIMKDPEVKRMCNWMEYVDRLVEPKRPIRCFPSVKVKPPFYVKEEIYGPDCSLRYNHSHSARLHRKEILDEFIKKKMEEKERLSKLKKQLKEIKRREKEDVNLAETQGEEDVGGGVEDSHGNRKELMLDVSASMQADQRRCTTSPYEQTGNLMVGGLKVCTTEAEKKTGAHSEAV